MAVKIRLKRLGKIRSPHYRIVVADSRTKRDGRAIEEIGKYHPKNDPSVIEVDSERAQYWLSVGAQPSEAVVAIFKRTGDWQKFSGDTSPSGVEPQKVKPNKLDLFNAALAEAGSEPRGARSTEAGRSSRRAPRRPTRGRGHPGGGPAGRRRRCRRCGSHRQSLLMLTEALEHLVRGIVNHPDDVAVRDKDQRRGPDARGAGQPRGHRQGDRSSGPYRDRAADRRRRARRA